MFTGNGISNIYFSIILATRNTDPIRFIMKCINGKKSWPPFSVMSVMNVTTAISNSEGTKKLNMKMFLHVFLFSKEINLL